MGSVREIGCDMRNNITPIWLIVFVNSAFCVAADSQYSKVKLGVQGGASFSNASTPADIANWKSNAIQMLLGVSLYFYEV